MTSPVTPVDNPATSPTILSAMRLKDKFGQELHLLTKIIRKTASRAMVKVVVKTIPATTMPKTGGVDMETIADLTTSLTRRDPILEEKGRARVKAKAKAEEATVASRRKSLTNLELL